LEKRTTIRGNYLSNKTLPPVYGTYTKKTNAFHCLQCSQLKFCGQPWPHTIFQHKNSAFTKMRFFAYSSLSGPSYSVPLSNAVRLDDELDESALLSLKLFFDGVLWGLLAAWFCPSSASFFMMFMIVGTNLVDKEMIAGSWRRKKG